MILVDSVHLTKVIEIIGMPKNGNEIKFKKTMKTWKISEN